MSNPVPFDEGTWSDVVIPRRCAAIDEHCGVLIVTGGSRGIGSAVADLAGCRGSAVAINYRASHPKATGRTGEALQNCMNALDIRESLAKLDPNDARYRRSLARNYVSLRGAGPSEINGE
jgi:hypothetical protein